MVSDVTLHQVLCDATVLGIHNLRRSGRARVILTGRIWEDTELELDHMRDTPSTHQRGSRRKETGGHLSVGVSAVTWRKRFAVSIMIVWKNGCDRMHLVWSRRAWWLATEEGE